jgi:HD superfamily phosphohydrolase
MNEIRDPIYGFIKPSDTELKIINTLLLQRLRRIKQLAMASLVYPGATHTRFDHSLGVYHIASLMADILLPDEGDRERRDIVRFSALLHDIGHGPFSHVSEAVLNKYVKSDNEEKVHEQITQRLIESDGELKIILSPSQIKMIIGLLNGRKVDYSIMKEIVSGPLDADKMDYLLRDSYFCGVKYGIFDLHRLINTLESYSEGIDKHIAIKYDGLNSLEQFVLAKYYMTQQVYRHKVRILSDSMIVRGLELGIEKDDIPFLRDLFNFREDADYLTNYLRFSDDKILNDILFLNKRGYAFEIFNRLYQRRLFKRIFSEKLNKITPLATLVRDRLISINKNEKLRKQIEEKVSQLDILKCDPNYVIVNSLTFKSVNEMSRGDNEGKLIIKTKDDSPAEFQEESMVFNSINESLNEVYLEVYAPAEFETVLEKDNKMKEFRDEILRLLKELNQEG